MRISFAVVTSPIRMEGPVWATVAGVVALGKERDSSAVTACGELSGTLGLVGAGGVCRFAVSTRFAGDVGVGRSTGG